MSICWQRPFHLGLVMLLVSPSLLAQTFSFAPQRLVVAYGTNNVQPGPFEAVDLNGDGNTDIILNGRAWLGDGKGGFSTTPIVLKGACLLCPLSDVDGDGKADAVYFDPGDYPPYGNGYGRLWVALGDGRGNFTTSTLLGFPATGQGQLVIGDFNRDGLLDIAVVTAGTQTDSGPTPGVLMTFLNTGQGKFVADQNEPLPTLEPTGQTNALSTQLVTGDFEGDGVLDLAWGQFSQSQTQRFGLQINTLRGNGDGTFEVGKPYLVDAAPLSLATADLNHDGKWDLVVGLDAKRNPSGTILAGATPRVATLLAKQAGGFYWSSAVSIPNTNSPSASLMDLNGDGILDAVLSDYGEIYVLRGEGGGKFSAPTVVRSAPTGYSIPVFAPLATGGLPSAFFSGGSCEPNCHVDLFMNTSKP